ncbi:hypothetical protein M3P05_12575 [Sansalvadorimonas sp. 2012CJ34-2]|uniref:Transposase n=1 Tax=Parendozoicomonas callyspongiae TaxID=2942213 RepID=A0ABT0PHB7_9GAMM|nr:hypothetical protein [Sansalvadorimonas sp. 2012CJ34-2]MCL6270759.1 hypothetical protein [Sansalvadorimonas sp. 2012CJ34-2]
MPAKKTTGRAEAMFREAFERLKKNTPNRLPKGTFVSQNNVAKEAGVDPSALRSVRYPDLSAEIKQWVRAHPKVGPTSVHQATLAKRAATRQLRERIQVLTIQRDKAAARLLEAEAEIIQLLMRVSNLEDQLPHT